MLYSGRRTALKSLAGAAGTLGQAENELFILVGPNRTPLSTESRATDPHPKMPDMNLSRSEISISEASL
jgi:hypothetical protein